MDSPASTATGPARLLGADDLAGWAETLGALAPATRRFRISTVRGFTAWMVKRGYISADPAGELPRVRLPRYLPRQVEAGSVARLLEVCPDERARLIVLCEVQEGLRCAEVAGLKVADVSLIDGVILVRGKRGHERLLPLSDETRAALEVYLDRHPTTAGHSCGPTAPRGHPCGSTRCRGWWPTGWPRSGSSAGRATA